MADSTQSPTSMSPEAADHLRKVVGRLVKANPGRDVLRYSALVRIGKPYDSFATLLASTVYTATFEVAPYVPTPTEGLQAVALDLANAVDELKRIRELPGLSASFKKNVAAARSSLIHIVYLLDDASRRGLGFGGKRKAGE